MRIPSQSWLFEFFRDAGIKILNEAGCPTTLRICPGNPEIILVEEAEKWNAVAIFVGANGFGSRVERFLLSSVSAAVAARAHCSVGVVRRLQKFS